MARRDGVRQKAPFRKDRVAQRLSTAKFHSGTRPTAPPREGVQCHFPRSEQSSPGRYASALSSAPMESTGGFLLCGRCRALVLICSHCDRSQIYCGNACSK